MLRFFELNSIRHRMLSGFLFLTLLILIVGSVSVYQLNQVSKMANTHRHINKLQVYTLNLIKNDNDFFDFELTNDTYFETRHSPFLTKRDSLLTLLSRDLAWIKSDGKQQRYTFHHLIAIDSLFKRYNKKFDSLESLIFLRGFKDFGLEGEMRKHAHALELPQMNISLVDVLTLRRSEKDYLLRHDTSYRSLYNRLSNDLLGRLKRDSSGNHDALFHLGQYHKLFNQRADVEQIIGLSSHDGLRHELNMLTTALSEQYFALTEYAGNMYENVQTNTRIFYITVTTAAILFSILSGLWISRRLSEPISRLSKLAHSATTTQAGKTVDFSLNKAAHEINALANAFITLIDQTKRQMREIEEKSNLLKTRNEELDKLNKELDSFLYSAAHDLRSPLSSLLGMVRLMKIENTQVEMVPYLEMMQNSIHRQEDFISQIVSYAKNNKLDVSPEPIDLKQMLLDIFQNHEFVTGASQIEKFIYIKDEVPFSSDKNRLYIIFNNLVSNAIRYADLTKEDPFIQVRVHVTEETAFVEFADNGVGIGAEHVSKIFDMFYRANFQSKGSGLGLFIFKEAIQKLHGLVSVESELGEGTKFFIQLPNASRQVALPLMTNELV